MIFDCIPTSIEKIRMIAKSNGLAERNLLT